MVGPGVGDGGKGEGLKRRQHQVGGHLVVIATHRRRKPLGPRMPGDSEVVAADPVWVV